MSTENAAPATIETPVAPEATEATQETEPKAEEAAQPEEKAETKPPRKFKAKIRGREVELDEEEVIQSGLTAAQIRRAANEQFEEAKKAKAEVESWRKSLEEDPLGALGKMLGGEDKFKALAEQYLIRQMQMEQLDPKERALLEARQELEAERQRVKEYESKTQQAQIEAAAKHYAERYNSEWPEAFAKVGLPKTKETVRRMAELTQRSIQLGIEQDAVSLAKLVREDFVEEQRASFESLEGDELLTALGPALVKKIRMADVARVKAKQAPAAQPTRAAATNTPPRTKPLTREELLMRLGVDPFFSAR